MQIQLNEAELEVAVTLYLSNQGMNLKNKTLSLSFDGECTMDIEPNETEVADATPKPKPKQTRKKVATPKKEVADEPVAETVPVEDVVEALVEQTAAPQAEDNEDLFPTTSEKPEEAVDENSLFS